MVDKKNEGVIVRVHYAMWQGLIGQPVSKSA